MSARRLGAAVGLALALAAPVVAAAPAAAAPALVTAEADVAVDEQGTAQAEIHYVVDGGAEGEAPAETLSFSALEFQDAAVEDIEVSTADGQELDVAVETVELETIATVTLDEPLAPGSQAELDVTYSVPGAGVADGDRMTVRAPVLALDLPAATTRAGVFTASLTLPSGHSYVEGFPANPERVTEDADGTQIHYDVPTMTSLLRTVSTTGDAPFFTLEQTVNLVLAVTLLAGGVALYFSFTRGRRRAAEVAAAGAGPDAGRSARPERRH